MASPVPILDAATLFGSGSASRDELDAAILAAAAGVGFMVLRGLPEDARLDDERRAELISIFDLPADAKRSLYRSRYLPGNPNVYRGMTPLRPDEGAGTERIEIGPDAMGPGRLRGGSDRLQEPTPWPSESVLPGWRAAVGRYFGAVEALGMALVASLERSLDLSSGRLGDAFEDGHSMLSLTRYPQPGELADEIRAGRIALAGGGGGRLVLAVEHTDFGCVRFVQQDGEAGLEARATDGSWQPVPSPKGSVAVHFGQLLERWTAGRIVATEHRLLGRENGRVLLPFSFEPALDARIGPLGPEPGDSSTEPLLYGDYLWSRLQGLPEYQDLGSRLSEPWET
jgi:isopenicillin N synthase-like dioxygenase